MKAKTAFESGNSPPKVSESGALIQTGRGLEETKRRIMQAFEEARKKHTTLDEPHPVQHVVPPSPPPQIEYTEQHKIRFHERAKRLSLAALSSSHIMKATRSNVFEIAVPTESAEELIREALGE